MITNTLAKNALSIDPNRGEFLGVHTDAKPTDVSVNSIFIELDTGDVYYYTGAAWAKVGA